MGGVAARRRAGDFMSEQGVDLRAPGSDRRTLVVRAAGWSVLGFLAAFLIENVLDVGFGIPVSRAIFSDGGAAATLPLAAYVICVGLVNFLVFRGPETTLRADARRVHNFNVYLIRACFWSVLLIGIADVTIAFMRVEKLLILFVDADMVRSLGLARFVGSYVHIPLVITGFVIAYFTRTLGFAWLALLIVLAELSIVVSRFVFSYEQALMGDLVRYWYAALFLFASAYTLFDEGHVRVDVLYAGFGKRTRGFINAWGSILLGMSTSWVILAIGFNGHQSIINSPLMNFEITQTGGVGMFIKYQMAAFLGIFAITMLIQFVSYLFESVADFRGEPGHVEHETMVS